MPILSPRRFGGSERSLGLAAAKAGAASGFPAKRALTGQGRAAEWTSFWHARDGSEGDGACEDAAKVGGGGEPAARSSCGRERRSGFCRRRGTRRRQKPRRSERQQARRAKVSLPSRASRQRSGLEDNLPEMSSAGTDGSRTCGGTEQDSVPDAEAGRDGGRLPGRERQQFERSGVKGAEVEAD